MKKNNFGALLVLGVAGSFAAMPAVADIKTDQVIAKAEEQFAKGKPDEAIKSLQKLLSGSPSVEAYLALARFQQMNGSADESAASVAKAVEVGASAAPAQKAKALAASAHLTLQTSTGKAAVDIANKAVAAERNGDSLGALAAAQARVGDAKAAHAAADAAIAASASSSAAHAGKGHALRASGQAAEAVAAFQKATTLDPRNVDAYVGLAYALVAAGKPAEAKVAATRATELNKGSGAAFAALGYAISAEKNFSGTDASWGDAIAQAQQGVFLAPKDPQVQMVVAKLFEARGNYDQAKLAYTTAVANDPGFAPARTALTMAKFRSGDLDGALRDVTELIKASPESPDANRLYGELLARKGQYKEAIPALEKATSAMPNDKDAVAMLAHSYHMTRSFEDAKNAYAKAVQLNPTNNDIKSNYGLLLGMSGEPEKGIEVLSALTRAPGYKSAAGFANYGWVLSRTKPPRAVDAVGAYKRALEIEPSNGTIYFGLAQSHFYAEAYPEAIAAFEKAVQLDKSLAADARAGIANAEYFQAVKANRNAPDFTKTKAAIAAAEGAGRPAAWAIDAVARYEQAIAQGKAAEAAAAAQAAAAEAAGDAVDIGRLSRLLQKGSVSQRVDAANGLAAAGADAAEILGYALETDTTIVVRQAVVRSLQRMGAGARRAVPALRRYVSTQPLTNPTASADEMRVEMMEADLRRDIQQLLGRLR